MQVAAWLLAGTFSEMFSRPMHGICAQGWEKMLPVKLHKHQSAQDDNKRQRSQHGTALTQKVNISKQTACLTQKPYRALRYEQFMPNCDRSSLIHSSRYESSPFTQAFPFQLPM